MAVNPDGERALESRLVSYNRSQATLWEQNNDDRFSAAPLHIFVYDESRQLVGGLIARTHAIRSWLEVTVLWVDELHRGSGVGRNLMELAVKEARHRGCSRARLASSDYQAPAFYEKLGYSIYGRLENCPPGDTAFYFCKDLC